MTEQIAESPDIQPQYRIKRRPWYRRVGCLIGLFIWLTVMLIPCFFITLAFQQEIVITQGDAPNQVLRIWLINEARSRGLGVSNTTVYPDLQDEGLCVQTDVRFILWVGNSSPTSYCECFTPADGNLTLSSVQPGQCAP